MSDDADTPPDGRSEMRGDGFTRRRVNEIARANEEWRKKVDDRYKRNTKLVVFCCAVTLCANAIGFALLQGQRYDSLIESCGRSNQTADGVVGILQDFDARQGAITIAKNRFPHIDSCRDFADRQTSWFRL